MDDGCCPACIRKSEAERADIPHLDTDTNVLMYKNVQYSIGDYVYITPDAFSMPNRWSWDYVNFDLKTCQSKVYYKLS